MSDEPQFDADDMHVPPVEFLEPAGPGQPARLRQVDSHPTNARVRAHLNRKVDKPGKDTE